MTPKLPPPQSEIGLSIQALLPPLSAVKVTESVPSVCVCVCALTAELFDVRTQNVVQECNSTIQNPGLWRDVMI